MSHQGRGFPLQRPLYSMPSATPWLDAFVRAAAPGRRGRHYEESLQRASQSQAGEVAIMENDFSAIQPRRRTWSCEYWGRAQPFQVVSCKRAPKSIETGVLGPAAGSKLTPWLFPCCLS